MSALLLSKRGVGTFVGAPCFDLFLSFFGAIMWKFIFECFYTIGLLFSFVDAPCFDHFLSLFGAITWKFILKYFNTIGLLFSFFSPKSFWPLGKHLLYALYSNELYVESVIHIIQFLDPFKTHRHTIMI